MLAKLSQTDHKVKKIRIKPKMIMKRFFLGFDFFNISYFS